MDKVFLKQKEQTHVSTSLLMLLFNAAVISLFINWNRLNALVIANLIFLILISIVNTSLFMNKKFSQKTMTSLNYFFLFPALLGTILQVVL
jgi:hypothetical protein